MIFVGKIREFERFWNEQSIFRSYSCFQHSFSEFYCLVSVWLSNLRIVIRSSRVASETSNVNHDSRHSAISFQSASYFGHLRYRWFSLEGFYKVMSSLPTVDFTSLRLVRQACPPVSSGAWSTTAAAWSLPWWQGSPALTGASCCARRGLAASSSPGWALSTRCPTTGTPAGSSLARASLSSARPVCPDLGSVRSRHPALLAPPLHTASVVPLSVWPPRGTARTTSGPGWESSVSCRTSSPLTAGRCTGRRGPPPSSSTI